jgi:hypothetical protein
LTNIGKTTFGVVSSIPVSATKMLLWKKTDLLGTMVFSRVAWLRNQPLEWKVTDICGRAKTQSMGYSTSHLEVAYHRFALQQ